jgi:hypothetical protein
VSDCDQLHPAGFHYKSDAAVPVTAGHGVCILIMKWPTKSGHRVKVVKCHDEVSDDNAPGCIKVNINREEERRVFVAKGTEVSCWPNEFGACHLLTTRVCYSNQPVSLRYGLTVG